jgi:hypothetical protein
MTAHNLDSRLEKLEARCPVRNQLVVILAEGEDGYAARYAEAERQAKEQGKELFVVQLVSPPRSRISVQPEELPPAPGVSESEFSMYGRAIWQGWRSVRQWGTETFTHTTMLGKTL